jgi:hypothetical protein
VKRPPKLLKMLPTQLPMQLPPYKLLHLLLPMPHPLSLQPLLTLPTLLLPLRQLLLTLPKQLLTQ